MKFQKLKKLVQLTSLIFAGIVILEMAAGQKLQNRMLWEFLACAGASSLVKLCFFRESLFENSVWRQIAYLISVWVIGILCNGLFGWGVAWNTIVSILAEVLIVYLAIRLVNYQFIKSEVKRMNKRLGKPGERKEDKPSD